MVVLLILTPLLFGLLDVGRPFLSRSCTTLSGPDLT